MRAGAGSGGEVTSGEIAIFASVLVAESADLAPGDPRRIARLASSLMGAQVIGAKAERDAICAWLSATWVGCPVDEMVQAIRDGKHVARQVKP